MLVHSIYCTDWHTAHDNQQQLMVHGSCQFEATIGPELESIHNIYCRTAHVNPQQIIVHSSRQSTASLVHGPFQSTTFTGTQSMPIHSNYCSTAHNNPQQLTNVPGSCQSRETTNVQLMPIHSNYWYIAHVNPSSCQFTATTDPQLAPSKATTGQHSKADPPQLLVHSLCQSTALGSQLMPVHGNYCCTVFSC
jgi:hypothetical protein